MKFSPLILVALVSTAAAAPPKCRPKSPHGSSSPAVSSSSSAAPSSSSGAPAVPSLSAAPTASAGNSSAETPAVSEASPSSSASSSAVSESNTSSLLPSSSSAESSSSAAATTSPPAEAPTLAPSAAPSSAAPAPIPSGNSGGNATTNPNYTPPHTTDEDRFIDPNVKPSLPAPIGKRPTVDGIVFPPGSVGINPDSGIAASDPIAQIFTSRFNEWRSVWGAPPVQWNQTLSDWGVDHAKKCQYEHFMTGAHGQVLDTMGQDVKAIDFAYQAKLSIDRWMVEGKDYNYNTNTANPGKKSGHFEIITDPRFTQVGCGWRSCGNIYCDFTRDFPKEWAEKLPDYKEHVYPRIEVPWDNYSDAFWQRK